MVQTIADRQAPYAPASTAGWQLGLQTLNTEMADGVELEVSGRLPAELRGTLYRVGAAAWEVAGERYRHWLDGDGMVHALRLEDGRAVYRNRFVVTAGREEERRAGRRLYAGFGTRPGGNNAWQRFRNLTRRFPAKNTANTNIIEIGGRLLALWEAGGPPHRIDPITLETLGQDDLGGILGAHDTFSAHPHGHPSGDLWNFGIQYGPRTRARLYRCRSDGLVTREHSVTLPFSAMVHDFAITERHAVLIIAPLTLPAVPLTLLLGQTSYAESLHWRPERGTHVAVVDLHSGETRWHRTEPFALFHTVNAWDEGDDVVVDVCAYPDDRIIRFLYEVMTGSIPATPFAWPERLVLDASGGTHTQRLSETPLEFPRVAPRSDAREHRRIYGVTHNHAGHFIGAPACVDLDLGKVATAPMQSHEFAGECVPVSKERAKTDADVWLLTLVLNADDARSELRVLDGADIGAGAVATVTLPHAVPFGFHGNWVNARS
jgi:all-trans-8'-apo-beta-carotenal 15,15'-oxygenase